MRWRTRRANSGLTQFGQATYADYGVVLFKGVRQVASERLADIRKVSALTSLLYQATAELTLENVVLHQNAARTPLPREALRPCRSQSGQAPRLSRVAGNPAGLSRSSSC
jgi:hypothetical protein